MAKQLQEILADIDAGLTGNDERDIDYLHACADKYKDEPNQLEIRRHIGRHLSRRMPEEDKREFEAAYASSVQRIKQTLNDAAAMLKNNNVDAAEKLLIDNSLEEGISDTLMRADELTAYYNFDNFIEEAFYNVKFKPSKKVMDIGLPFKKSYHLAAFIAFERKDLDKALRILNTGIERCPLASELIFEQMEVYKMLDRMHEFWKTLRATSNYWYRKRDIAHYFRNCGWYFTNKQDWDTAIACYAVSGIYDTSDMMSRELTYIQQTSGKTIEEMQKLLGDYAGCKELLAKQDLNVISVDPLWLQVFKHFGELAEQQGNYETASFCYGTLYDLTNDERFGQKAQECFVHLAAAEPQ